MRALSYVFNLCVFFSVQDHIFRIFTLIFKKRGKLRLWARAGKVAKLIIEGLEYEN